MITTLDFSDKEDFIDNISDAELMPDLHKQGGINLLLSKWVPVRGSQMVQLHPSIFEENLICTHQFKNFNWIFGTYVRIRKFCTPQF